MSKVREQVESQSCYLLLWVIATHNAQYTVILHALMAHNRHNTGTDVADKSCASRTRPYFITHQTVM